MQKIFYTSDLHLGHANSIKFDGRPFKNTIDMGEEMLRRWNKKVGKADIVYLLGDVCWKNTDEEVGIIQKMNGQKHLVKGNHDRLNAPLKACFESINNYKEIKDQGRNVVLSHYPMPVFKNHYYKNNYMLYGHVHNSVESLVVDKLRKIMENNGFPCEMYNVGCMVWNYEPVTLDEVLGTEVSKDE